MAQNNTDNHIEKMKDTITELKNELKSKEGVQNIIKGASMAKEGIEQSAYELGSKIKEEVNKSQEYAKNTLHYVEEQAKNQPFLAIGISFLLGMIVSRLCKSK
ncbi:hypothetical protein [Rickettsiales endosymbiont of Stachyamoeba lipophora]|uniref:hypothetical protein n=1 Tax=Rickettsiales endosymbiont of Stachyamoeba lipophora TaxID=2486578 RepID=UPI000F64A06C|nr:hypothetical protein [Rickettsiales endosymbiont of Stachyamoeba lipophora]AZL15052.1 hypothetical protein EF513_00525 [Rickettsiales endosymbiont of Stachyamoeba lipophora]